MKKENNVEISAKSTKEQILSAYNQVLNRLNDQESLSPKESKKKAEEIGLVKSSADNSQELIVRSLGQLKTNVIKQLDLLSEELLSEFSNLLNIRKAIEIEQGHLEELYQIKETANSLAALIKAYHEQMDTMRLESEQAKIKIDEEVAQKSCEWREKNQRIEAEYAEKKELLEKTRRREEEEYKYNLSLARKKEMDEYNHKKIVLEKELADMSVNLEERELDISKQEELLNELQLQVAGFDAKLLESVTMAEMELQERISREYEFKFELCSKEYESDKKLYQQKIEHLESKISAEEGLNKDLMLKLEEATKKVESIAYRAIDASASTPRFLYQGQQNVQEEKGSSQK